MSWRVYLCTLLSIVVNFKDSRLCFSFPISLMHVVLFNHEENMTKHIFFMIVQVNNYCKDYGIVENNSDMKLILSFLSMSYSRAIEVR